MKWQNYFYKFNVQRKKEMIETKFDKRALTEVYNILIMLDREKFEKIPNNIITTIHDNMDLTYNIELDKIEDGEILEDTEKILSIIYTEYLATPEEKEIIEHLTIVPQQVEERIEEYSNIKQYYKEPKIKKESFFENIKNTCFKIIEGTPRIYNQRST